MISKIVKKITPNIKYFSNLHVI